MANLCVMALMLCLASVGRAQVTFTDIGGAPTPGPNDVAQLSLAGDAEFPDTLNYFTDNGANNGAYAGQTFITGNNPSGYTMTRISIATAGLYDGGGYQAVQLFNLYVYSVSGGTATLMQSYTATGSFTDGHWLQWARLAVALQPNSAYAYAFGRSSSGEGWAGLGNATNHPYPGGEIALIPPTGGTITFGASHAIDAAFVVGLTVPTEMLSITEQPASEVLYAGQMANFTVAAIGAPVLQYQWQKNGANLFDGATVSGSLSNTLTISDISAADAASYGVLVSNSQGAAASATATLTVVSAPVAGSYPAAVLGDNPLAYWRLNDTGDPSTNAPAYDWVGGYNGVYGAAAQNGFSGVAGPRFPGFPGFETNNRGAQFTNVANSFVSVPALNLDTNTVTITAWIYPIGTPAAFCGLVFCRPGSDASGLNFSSGGQIGYTWNQNNQNTWSWMSGLVPPLQQWSFVALVVYPTSAIVYLCSADGQLSATNAIVHTSEAFNANTLIGDDSADGGNGARSFNGIMDEVAIFDYTLTPAQVLELYYAAATSGAPVPSAPAASPFNSIVAGTTVTLTVTVSGAPPFQYQWQANGANVSGATNSTLVLTNTTLAMSGTYDVLVSNAYGSTNSPSLVVTVSAYPAIIIDTSLAGQRQAIDGFGTCLYGSEAVQSWWQNLYYGDLQASMLRMDLTPVFNSPYSDNNYNCPGYGQPGPDGNYVRTYTNATTYTNLFSGLQAKIAVMGPNIDSNIACFDFTTSGSNPQVAGLAAQAGKSSLNGLGDFKLFGSLWSPAPWLKLVDGNTYDTNNGGGANFPAANTTFPFIWLGNFAGGVLDTSGTPRPEFDDSSLGGTGPTSALTQFARCTAAYLRGFQNTYGVPFYAFSIQNELDFDEYYNSCFYPLTNGYLAAIEAVRAELNMYPDLAGIRIMGPEDDLGGDYSLWQYGNTSYPFIAKNLQFVQAVGANPVAAAAEAFFCIHDYDNDSVQANDPTRITHWNWWVNGWTTSPDPGIAANVRGFTYYGKKSWQTENSGEDPAWLNPSSGFPGGGAWSVALRIQQALTVGQESAWAYWQMTDGNPVSGGTLTDSTTVQNSPKYVAAKHFFRYIRPNSIRVNATVNGSTALTASAFLHNTNGTMTVVLINSSNSPVQTVVNSPAQPAGIPWWQTFTSSSGSYWQISTTPITSGSANVTVPGYGVVTLYGVAPAGLSLTWNNPAAITYGTALSSNQLNAAANVPGAFSYTPAIGTVLDAGTNTLSVVFTPTDVVDYSSATTNVSLVVLPAAPAFVGAVLAANPVGYWRLNETNHPSSGSVVAVDTLNHFNGNYGSASADGVPGPTPSVGFPGFESSNTAAEFTNGVANSYATLPALKLNTNTVTITAWIYPIGAPASYAGLVFCRPGSDASGLDFTSGGQIGYTWNQNNQNTWGWMSGLVPPLRQWSFVALVISPASAVAYLCNTNGQSSATNAIAHTSEAFNANTLIGNDPADGGNGARTFNGIMDEVAIFNSALTRPQVLGLYDASSGGSTNQVPPQLSIAKGANGSVLIAWPLAAAGVLQQSFSVAGPWANVSTAPSQVNGNYQLSIMATSSAQFFRLLLQ